MVRSAIEQLAKSLAAGQSAQLRRYLAAMGHFHRYSLGNVLLICMQFADASRVAGYNTWRRLGRHVRRGARGIRILAPVAYRVADPDDPAERAVAFKSVCVFDVSQTEGRPLPTPAEVQGDPGLKLARLKRWATANGIRVEYTSTLGGADGASCGGRILLRVGLTPAVEFAVLVHELAHEALHVERDEALPSRTVRETEAEAIAFVVCDAIGLEVGTAMSDYIQTYDGNRDTLLASLTRIQQTARHILEGVLADETHGTPRAGLFVGRKRPAA
jgi:antirestriction protein ArdC